MTETQTTTPVLPYTVFVDDNFHFMDQGERYRHGAFATWNEAVGACQRMVDEELLGMIKPGMSADELFGLYTSFGADPFILASGSHAAGQRFSAWDYARERSRALLSDTR